MDPTHSTRPTLDVENLDISHRQSHQRKKAFRHRLKKLVNASSHEKHKISRILSKYRERQRRNLGSKDEDPDPYDSKYIFYCLETPNHK
jgi:hypothetical protein